MRRDVAPIRPVDTSPADPRPASARLGLRVGAALIAQLDEAGDDERLADVLDADEAEEGVAVVHGGDPLPLLSHQAALAAPAAPPHDTAFWHALAAKEFAVPEGESVSALALEATELLSSPDPKLRDSVAFDALARWVYVQGLVPPDGLEALRLRLQEGLAKGLSESGTDSAYGRSFSALALSILAAVDLKSPWMTKEAFEDLLAATTRYLTAEKDVRGFVAGAGWVHAAAHTADVLKFLGRNPKLTPAGQAGSSRRSRRASGPPASSTHGARTNASPSPSSP